MVRNQSANALCGLPVKKDAECAQSHGNGDEIPTGFIRSRLLAQERTDTERLCSCTQGLENLIKEYDESIDDPLVYSQDHHDIAKDVEEWIPKIRAHLEYMSDIITTVKGQAVASLSSDDSEEFTIAELVKRVNILMKHELKNAYIYLNILMKVDENTVIDGNVNVLVQVEKYKEMQFYSHVIHLVSRVSGTLERDSTPFSTFTDTFPAGTLSGRSW